MTRYTQKTLINITLLVMLVMACLWLSNPYLLFNSPEINGINKYITENYYQQLLFKPYQLRHIQPRSIIIGASQAGVAFNPEQLPAPAYNLAVGGSTAYIHYRLLQEAIQASPTVDNIILELPFFAFNQNDVNNQVGQQPDFEKRLTLHADGTRNTLQPLIATQEKLSGLTGWDSVRAAARMISKQETVANGKRGSFIQLRNGQWIQQQPPNISTMQLIETSWKKTIFNDWLPAPSYNYSLTNADNSALSWYRDSLRLLYKHNIRTRLVIAPMHASLFIALQETELWPIFQTWKKQLVLINEAAAKESGQTPFPLFDYSIINSITSEPLPDPQTYTRLKNFYDSMHPSLSLGEKVLQEILSEQPASGHLLNSKNIDTLLADDHQQLLQYTALHPQQQAAIRTLLVNNPHTRPRFQQ